MASGSNTVEKKIDSEIKTEPASTNLDGLLHAAAAAAAEEEIESKAGKKVILKSSDGELFEVDESIAKQMAMVKNVLEDRAETDSAYSSAEPIPLIDHVAAKDLAVILEYLNKSGEIRARKNKSGGGAGAAVRELGKELASKLALNDEIKSVLLATNYLELKEFQDVLSQNIADRISRRTVEFVRGFFGVENDFTEEEEAAIMRENRWAFDGAEYDED